MSALVLLSGGLDSTVALFWALRFYPTVAAVTFDYGQRHFKELAAASAIAKMAGVPHEFRNIAFMKKVAPAPLTTMGDPIATAAASVVPGRNMIMLSIAAMVARGADLVFGACAADQADYPDCKPEFFRAMGATLAAAGFAGTIATPIIGMTKAETVKMANDLPGCMDAVALSVTCYEAHAPRAGCGACPACRVRAAGFVEAGVRDPIAGGRL